jgi:hypothetical protein
MINKDKQVRITACKGLGDGAEITDEQYKKISRYTLKEIPKDQLYIRKIRLAHNAIDRDNERFSEKLLDDFVRTLPGKSLLIGHNWGPPGKGRFFDAYLEETDLNEAKKETGEDIRLPDGIDKVKFLMTHFYTTKTSGKEELLSDIDAGIVSHASIGFNAETLLPVTNEENGDVLYREYKAPGEALEGSLVWH